MTTKKSDFPDLNALAIEACDMWQEHLSTLASDPAARAELTRYLEPQRRMFADWASMMQQGGSHESQHAKNTPHTSPSGDAAKPQSQRPETASTTSGGSPHGDDSLRAAQLALRVAELEKRIGQLESRLAGTPRRTQRTSS